MKRMRFLLAVSLLVFSLSSGSVYASSHVTLDSDSDVSDVVDRATDVRQRAEERREAVRQRIEQRRDAIQTRVELRREKIATRVAEIRRRVAEHRKVLIRRFFKRMLRRFEAATVRLGRIADRIESRLDKMEAREIDVSGLREDLADVRDDLSVAEGLLDGLEAKVEELLASDDPKAAFGIVRDTVLETRDMLKDIHKQFVEIIRQMKGPQTGVGEATPSSTVE